MFKVVFFFFFLKKKDNSLCFNLVLNMLMLIMPFLQANVYTKQSKFVYGRDSDRLCVFYLHNSACA